MGIVDIKIEMARRNRWGKCCRRAISKPHQQHYEEGQSSFTAGEVNSDQYMDHKLYWAAAKGNEARLQSVVERLCVERGPNVSQNNVLQCVSPQGNSLLHVAAEHGNLRVLRHVAEFYRSCSPTCSNCNGDTPLHLAAKAGHEDTVVELLLIAHIDGNGASDDLITRKQNEQGNTALHMALISSKKPIADCLFEADPDAIFWVNKENKSCLYLAAEAGYEKLITDAMERYKEEENQLHETIKGKPPVHAAVLGRKLGTLRILVEQEPKLVHSRDDEGRTPLHHAALTGWLEGVTELLSKHSCATVIKDYFGFFPIHLAIMEGRVDVLEILLDYSVDPAELLDNKRRNVLHIAAEYGKTTVFIYILKKLDCRKLINAKDKDGNTPLHLATMNWHPRMVSALTWDEKLDSSVTNNDGLTALDAAEFYIDGRTSFQQRLTWTALIAAGVPRAPPTYSQNFPSQLNESFRPAACINNYKDRVNTLLVVATLIATITFAAGFTVPGGYKNTSDKHEGQSALLGRKIFSLFVFSDSIAMYSAMTVAVLMIWAQLGDLSLVLIALRLGLRLIGVSLTMMSIAFMAGIYAVVSDLRWLSQVVLITGIIFVTALSCLSFPLCFPISSTTPILRYLSYYPFLLLMYITKSGISSNWEDKYFRSSLEDEHSAICSGKKTTATSVPPQASGVDELVPSD